jgi:hypothetical protein
MTYESWCVSGDQSVSMTPIDPEHSSKANDSVLGGRDESSLFTLELPPGSQYRLARMLVGVSIVVLILSALTPLLQPTNSDNVWIVAFGFLLVGLSIPTFLSARATRRLEVSGDGIRFFRGDTLRKSLPWNRVEKIQWGAAKRPSPTGKWRQSTYITFFARPSRQSIRVLGRVFDVAPKAVEQVALAAATLARTHSVPFEQRELLF